MRDQRVVEMLGKRVIPCYHNYYLLKRAVNLENQYYTDRELAILKKYIERMESNLFSERQHMKREVEELREKLSKNNDKDMVNRPPHYTTGKIEVIDFLEDKFSDDPLLWNACKYLARSKHKGKEGEDLRKAIYFINRKIKKLEKK